MFGKTLLAAAALLSAGLFGGTVSLLLGRQPHSTEAPASVDRYGKLLASTGHDGSVRLWDVAARKELGRLPPEKSAERTSNEPSQKISR